MLIVREHSSKFYGPRTWANAADADVTIAIAVDYNTTGERLTHKAAGDKYLALPLKDDWIVNARRLYTFMKVRNAHGINVAGNGIYTLSKHGYTQAAVNALVFSMLETVSQHLKIDKIVSGGQTGIDLAGGYAGWKLDIDTVLTLPNGCIQRHEDGIDRPHTRQEIIRQITGE